MLVMMVMLEKKTMTGESGDHDDTGARLQSSDSWKGPLKVI